MLFPIPEKLGGNIMYVINNPVFEFKRFGIPFLQLFSCIHLVPD